MKRLFAFHHLNITGMKKILTLSLLLILLPCSLFPQAITVGGGVDFGTGFTYRTDAVSGSAANNYDSGNLGFFVRGGYKLESSAEISLSCLYALPASYEGSIADVGYSHTVSSVMADLNVNYTVLEGGMADIYGVGGINLHFVGYKYSENYIDTNSGEEITFKTKQSDNTIGLNIGAGTVFDVGERMSLFAEAKYIISYYGQFIFSVGMRFDI